MTGISFHHCRRAAGLALALAAVACAGACADDRAHDGERVVFDLVERFDSAEIFEEPSFLIDFGKPSARPHLRSGFAGDEGEGESDFVWGIGEASRIAFHMSHRRDLPIEIFGAPAPFDVGPQAVGFLLNGRLQAEVELEPGQRTYELVLARDAMREGNNELELRYRWAHAPSELMPPHPDVRPLAVQWVWLRFGSPDRPRPRTAAVGEGEDRELVLPFGARADYYLRLPAGSTLALGGLRDEPSGGTLHVRVLTDEGDGLRVPPQSASRRPIRLALNEDEPVIAVLSLEASGPSPDAVGTLRIPRPEVRAPDPRAARSASTVTSAGPDRGPGGAGDPPPPRHVVLYISDTLRVDRLGVYGSGRDLTPRLDAFAGDAIVFERAVAQASYTRPTTASIMTGLDPSGHAVLGTRDRLSESAGTLAEILGGEGFETAAFVANPQVGRSFGFDQGFDEFVEIFARDPDRPSGLDLYRARASEGGVPYSAPQNEFVYDWLGRRSDDRPLFLYVHGVAPHSPYTPPQRWRERHAPEAPTHIELPSEAADALRELTAEAAERPGGHPPTDQVGEWPWMEALRRGRIPATEEVVAATRSLYDADVAFEDESFGALLDDLRGRGLYDEALVIFVSDHGEEFQEHGGWEHGRTLYPEVIDVPLIVKLPRSWGRNGERVAGTVGQFDVLPTVLDALGLEVPDGLHGRSLLADVEERPAFSYLRLGHFQGASVTVDHWRLIETFGRDARVELFDHRSDPQARIDVADRHPIVVGWLRGMLRERLSAGDTSLEAGVAEIDDELEAQLKELGYAW